MKPIGRFISRDGLGAPILAALLVAAIAAAVYWRLVPVLPRNDDDAFMRIAAGSFSGTPDSRWVFTNRILGAVVSWLYTVAPGTEWYVGYLYAVLLAALWALLTALLSGTNKRAAWLAPLAGVLLFPPALVELCWTTVAIWATLGGMLLAFRGTLAGRRGLLVAGLAIAALGSMVRFPVALMTVAVLAPLALSLAWDCRRIVVTAALAVGLFVGLEAVDSYGFRYGPQYAAWSDFNVTRARIHDTALMRMTATPELLAEVGWSGNDLRLFQRWFYSDPDLFSFEKVRKAVDVLERSRSDTTADFADSVVTALRGVPWDMWLVAALALLIVAGSALRTAGVLLASFSVMTAITMLVVWQFRADKAYFVPTLCHCIAAMGFFLAAQVNGHGGRDAKGGWRRAAIAVAAVVLLFRSQQIWGSLWQSGVNDALDWQRREPLMAAMLETARATAPEPSVFVLFGSSLYRRLPVFASHDLVHATPALLTGWTTFSHLHADVMKRFGFNSGLNLWDGLLEHPNSYLVISPIQLPVFLMYYREHRGIDVVATRNAAFADLNNDGRFVYDVRKR